MGQFSLRERTDQWKEITLLQLRVEAHGLDSLYSYLPKHNFLDGSRSLFGASVQNRIYPERDGHV